MQQLSSLHGIKDSSLSLPRTGNSWQTTAWKSEFAGEDLTMSRRAIAPVFMNASRFRERFAFKTKTGASAQWLILTGTISQLPMALASSRFDAHAVLCFASILYSKCQIIFGFKKLNVPFCGPHGAIRKLLVNLSNAASTIRLQLIAHFVARISCSGNDHMNVVCTRVGNPKFPATQVSMVLDFAFDDISSRLV